MFRHRNGGKKERRTLGTEEMLAEFVLSGFQEADEAGGSAICSEQGANSLWSPGKKGMKQVPSESVWW